MALLAALGVAMLAAAALAVAPVASAASAAYVAKPKPVVVAIAVVKGRVTGGVKRPTVKKGQVVRFVIRTDAGTEVHFHGYEIERTPRKGAPTVIQFTARLQGRFELELHSPDVLLAELTVR